MSHWLRRIIGTCAGALGGRSGRAIWRALEHYRLPPPQAVSWAEASRPIEDRNLTMGDAYCPICDGSTTFEVIADHVLTFRGRRIRKILYQCQTCRFLCTNEDRVARQDFFDQSSYSSEKSGHLTQREKDLIRIGLDLIGGSKDSSILVYGVGYNTTVAELAAEGYAHVWGSDMAQGVSYGDHIVDIGKHPDYFSTRGMTFDAIVACEVWEHYARHDVNPAFGWIFRHLSKEGIALGTTSLWTSHKSDDPIYHAPHEWGKRLLSWWTYPFFTDHTSFYRADNLRHLGQRFGMHAGIGYFQCATRQIGCQDKRIIAFVPEEFARGARNVRRRFDGRHHDVFFC